jgi:cellulose synthase/poly-beta-1,6-N-acetylglucosamine synthase-like glycosyltransferase
MDYLKIGKAAELENPKEHKLYRRLEMLPGFLSVGTILILLIFSYFTPVVVAYFIIAFNVYWLLLVIFLAVYLIAGFRELKKYRQMDWKKMCQDLPLNFLEADLTEEEKKNKPLHDQGLSWEDIIHLIILPTYHEDASIIRSCIKSLLDDGYPPEKMIVVLAMEERAGEPAQERARLMTAEFGNKFRNFLTTTHPDGIIGELKGKGANQAHAGKIVKEKIIDAENIPYEKILVSVFDIDTVVVPGYFFRLTHAFLTVPNAYRASYQPVPLYHNNIWRAPFFARVASSSNSFWQIMQQIRPEKLSTYSSHSMTFKALSDIGFWSPNMVSEDSRVFFNCLIFYKGDYRVEPLHFPILMDTTMDRNLKETVKTLYKQQRRWAWGSENVPYIIFNTIKNWETIDRKSMIRHILVQLYGFHSWATSAFIIAVVGWMPMLLGGDRFNSTVLSGNLPVITTWLMNIAMIGLIQSAVISTLLLPKRPKDFSIWQNILIVVEWVCVPITIIVFGSIPCLDAQIRLMLGKYMGFFVTPKSRE